ncbi:myelin-associated glycoprotein [Labrus mixtus]|uniref:myelin-associated glycoprotein n=1 Tax=Labrus mixtus TaxID=508554 RepID=UPI0029BFD0DD|nr:myelin-associated glycoprotein [Labrus mixtus]
MGVGLAGVALLVALMRGVSCEIWTVTLPQSIMGILESCITIPCGFQIPENREKDLLMNCSTGVVWKKDSKYGPVVFSEVNPKSNKIQGMVFGDLKKKNCTTTFHSLPQNYSGSYFFRLECLGDFKYTFTKGVIIIAQPGMPPPQLTPVKQVSEGDLVTLQCSVPVPCSILPPSLTWLPRDITWQAQTQIEQKADGLMVMTSTLTFIASADHHNRSVACYVSYPLTKGGSTKPSANTQRLNILYSPRSTVASLATPGPGPGSGSVSEGSSVTLICSSDANPPVSLFTWYRVLSGQLTKTAEGQTLFLQVRHNDSGLYLCEAQTQGGSQRSTPVSLQVNTYTGIDVGPLLIPNLISGVVLVLFVLTVALGVYQYQSLSRRLKQVELQGENTYADLRSLPADYDQLQSRQPKEKLSPDLSNYQNLQELQISKVGVSPSGSKGLH